MSGVLLFLAKFLWLILPGALANMAPVLGKNYLKSLAKPVDGGREWRGKPILGSHKTWRGFILGSLAGIIVGSLQHWAYISFPAIQEISIVDFSVIPGWFFGFLMGFGALFGDSVKSFFKRRANVKSGKPFFPWDQIDSYFGALIFILPFQQIPVDMLLFGAVAIPVLHVTINLLGYYMGIKSNKF